VLGCSKTEIFLVLMMELVVWMMALVDSFLSCLFLSPEEFSILDGILIYCFLERVLVDFFLFPKVVDFFLLADVEVDFFLLAVTLDFFLLVDFFLLLIFENEQE